MTATRLAALDLALAKVNAAITRQEQRTPFPTWADDPVLAFLYDHRRALGRERAEIVVRFGAVAS